jgi:hypothetical protein
VTDDVARERIYQDWRREIGCPISGPNCIPCKRSFGIVWDARGRLAEAETEELVERLSALLEYGCEDPNDGTCQFCRRILSGARAEVHSDDCDRNRAEDLLARRRRGCTGGEG